MKLILGLFLITSGFVDDMRLAILFATTLVFVNDGNHGTDILLIWPEPDFWTELEGASVNDLNFERQLGQALVDITMDTLRAR
jgi:hypothetical protein